MNAKKYLPIALFIGLQAAVLQAVDQAVCGSIAPELFNLVPAVFVGAGVFFGVMSYAPGATFANAFVGEGVYCLIGLAFGWLTITFRGWYEGKYVHTPAKK